MKKLRKRVIAKRYGVKYKRKVKKNGDFHLFKCKEYTIGFYFCSESTFLNVVKNKDKWLDFDFKAKI